MRQAKPPARQRGVALLLLLFLVVGVSATVALSAWNSTHGQLEQEQKTRQALQQAKDALIGAAVSDFSSPGRLSCPEMMPAASEGIAPYPCQTGTLTIGRLPWKTLKIDKLTDGYGEPLWYVVSNNFTKTKIINNNTLPQLQLDGGPAPVIALIIAPGPPVSGQSRSIPSMANPPKASDYLDLGNSSGPAFVSTGPLATFNDRFLTITSDEFFRALNRRVLAEIRGRDNLSSGLWLYADENGGQFPWADTTGDGLGDLNQQKGSLPFQQLKAPLAFMWLKDNNWFQLVTYTRTSGTSAQISVGNSAMNVTPCNAIPCR